MFSSSWSDHQIEKLKKLYKQGASLDAIAEAVGKQSTTVRQFVSRNRQKLGLERRNGQSVRPSHLTGEEFEKAWAGPVPYLHWSITQPWGSKK